MAVDMTQGSETTRGKAGKFLRTAWVTVEYLSVRLVEAFEVRLETLRQEIDLFLGASFFILGILNWSSAKFCDGNSSDYLSCTRPAVYYYYGSFEIVLVLLGTLLVLRWFVQHKN